MTKADAPLDLTTLCERAGVTARTVRYYIQRGLLPSPGRQGPGTPYEQGHLDRLRLIRQLQSEHLPLAEIRKRLDGIGDVEVAAALAGGMSGLTAMRMKKGSEALDYIRALKSKRPASDSTRRGGARKASPAEPFPKERAQWERLTLSDDIELHIRRPLTRQQNRRLDRLIKEARRILGQDG
jgi:DNA-binding transcriptional MerR regulator